MQHMQVQWRSCLLDEMSKRMYSEPSGSIVVAKRPGRTGFTLDFPVYTCTYSVIDVRNFFEEKTEKSNLGE